MMKKAGCKGINIGVETGDPHVLESQAKTGVSIEMLTKVRSFCKSVGIKLHFLLMLGLPGETKTSLYRTFKLVQKLGPESIGTTVVTPFPGTPLYNEAKENGWLETEDWGRYGSHYPVMHTDILSAQDILKAQNMIRRGFRLMNSKSFKNAIKLGLLSYYFRFWAGV